MWLLRRIFFGWKTKSSPGQLKALTPATPIPAQLVAEHEMERKEVILKAKEVLLLDGVFSIIHYNDHRRRWFISRISLDEVFPDSSSEELKAAAEKTNRLLRSAYDYGDALLSKRFSNSGEIKAKMMEDHPGFNEKSYHDTIQYGCFSAR